LKIRQQAEVVLVGDHAGMQAGGIVPVRRSVHQDQEAVAGQRHLDGQMDAPPAAGFLCGFDLHFLVLSLSIRAGVQKDPFHRQVQTCPQADLDAAANANRAVQRLDVAGRSIMVNGNLGFRH
jgi:hypothetical protein